MYMSLEKMKSIIKSYQREFPETDLNLFDFDEVCDMLTEMVYFVKDLLKAETDALEQKEPQAFNSINKARYAEEVLRELIWAIDEAVGIDEEEREKAGEEE
jgi:hypothetical protein